jgi:HSP20 family protein
LSKIIFSKKILSGKSGPLFAILKKIEDLSNKTIENLSNFFKEDKMKKDLTATNRNNELANPWFDDFMQPHRWLNQFFGNDIMPAFQNESRFLSPAIDIDETENEYLVTADLPGVKKEDLKVDHSGNRLTISAERKYDNTNGQKNERRERFFGTYQRSFTLPTGVDAEKIEASFENGVLRVQIPKAEASRSRRIDIKDQKMNEKTPRQEEKH